MTHGYIFKTTTYNLWNTIIYTSGGRKVTKNSPLFWELSPLQYTEEASLGIDSASLEVVLIATKSQ